MKKLVKLLTASCRFSLRRSGVIMFWKTALANFVGTLGAAVVVEIVWLLWHFREQVTRAARRAEEGFLTWCECSSCQERGKNES